MSTLLYNNTNLIHFQLTYLRAVVKVVKPHNFNLKSIFNYMLSTRLKVSLNFLTILVIPQLLVSDGYRVQIWGGFFNKSKFMFIINIKL